MEGTQQYRTTQFKSVLTVQSVIHIAADTFEMVLVNETIARRVKPGQFLHIIVKGHMLPRPLSIAECNDANKTITLLFKTEGSGTQTLALLRRGDVIEALGPLGNGFPLDQKPGAEVLLIGGGIGIPPLHMLGRELYAQGCKVKAVLGFQTRQQIFYETAFESFAETVVVTDDGSYGIKGLVTSALGDLSFIDCYYSCGPLPMLRSVADELKRMKGFLSLEARMGCGVGTCMACVVPDYEGGYRKICSDGPVFPVGEVKL